MSVKLSTSKKASQYVNCVIYGNSGIGKTPCAATAPKPVFIDTDGGLLSVSDLDIPSIRVKSIDDMIDAFRIVSGKKGKKFKTVIIDDLTELIEMEVVRLEDTTSDVWEVYKKTGKFGKKLIRKFKKLDMNIIFICKLHEAKDEGLMLRRPSLPGNILPEYLPYAVDEFFALRIDDKGKKFLQTQNTTKWYAKDRSCTLNPKEKPNMTNIFNKIKKGKKVS